MAFHYVKEHMLGPFLMLMGASKHPLVGQLKIPAGNAFGLDGRLGAACASLTVLCRPGFQAPILGSAPLAVCAFLMGAPGSTSPSDGDPPAERPCAVPSLPSGTHGAAC